MSRWLFVTLIMGLGLMTLAGCASNSTPSTGAALEATATVQVVQFSTAPATVTATTTPTPFLPATLAAINTGTPLPKATGTVEVSETALPGLPSATFTPVPAQPSPTPAPKITTVSPTASGDESSSKPAENFTLEGVRMRTNQENSWDGVLNEVCGSDHSIYVHVVDAAGTPLNDVLIGDRYGNFEVPTGPDGAGKVRVLVWSATMEVAVVGHKDGSRYTSPFTPPLSTLDEDIPLDWLQQGGYCESPEDCQRRASGNQLCRGHYSYDVLFKRTW